MAQPVELEVTSLRLRGEQKAASQLEDVLEHLRGQSRKRNVDAVEATLRFFDRLELRVEVQERGARLRVPGRGLYACTVDGVHRALADVVREEHGADAAMLDLYQRVLTEL